MMWNCKNSRRKQGKVFLTLNFAMTLEMTLRLKEQKQKFLKKGETTYLI